MGLLDALASTFSVIEFDDKARGLLWWPVKLVATALAPLVAVVGMASSLVGMRRGDPLTIVTGTAAMLLSTRYVARVVRPHDEFQRAFGTDWIEQIPGHLRRHMLPRRWTPLALAPRADWHRDLVIGSNPETGEPLLADLWLPPAGVPRSGLGVVYLHGGAWHIGNKDMGTRYLFRRLAGQGHVIVDVAYTLAPLADIPMMVTDAKRAVLWLKTHGEGYGVRPDRIALMGASAGGHLALLAAYTPNYPAFQPSELTGDATIRAVVSLYGVPDLRAAYADLEAARREFLTSGSDRLSKRAVELLLWAIGIVPVGTRVEEADNLLARLIGATLEERPDLFKELSPRYHAGRDCPPTLHLQGAADVFGMAPAVRELHQALCEAGATSLLVEFADTDHAFDNVLPQISPSAQAAIYDVERFLALMAGDTVHVGSHQEAQGEEA